MQQLRKEFQVDRDPGASSDQPWPVDQAVEHGGAVLSGSPWKPRISKDLASSWVLRMWSYILCGWMKYICCYFSSKVYAPKACQKRSLMFCNSEWHLWTVLTPFSFSSGTRADSICKLCGSLRHYKTVMSEKLGLWVNNNSSEWAIPSWLHSHTMVSNGPLSGW